VGEDRPKGDEDPETRAAGSLEELEAEASVPTLEAEAASLSEALDIPAAEDAAEAYHQRARLAEDRLAEVLAAYRKVKADNDGFRDRMKRSLDRQYEQRSERLLIKFIDVLDNFDRALEAAQTSYAGEPLVEGLILVRTQLLQTLKDQGLERIPVLGLPYDPHVSEAVGTQPVQDPDHHHLVVKDLLRGYRLKGKVVRPSRVLIGECAAVGGEPGGSEPEPTAAPADTATPEETTPPEEAAPPSGLVEPEDDEELVPLLGESELSLEEIIARAEAQDALFPPPESEEEPAAEPAAAPAPVAASVPGPEPPSGPPVVAPALVLPPEVADPAAPAETFALAEESFEKPDTRPIVFPDVDADTLAAALAEEGWPEGLELPGLEEGPPADKKRRKR
jgi:molecular chaperone GrpE